MLVLHPDAISREHLTGLIAGEGFDAHPVGLLTDAERTLRQGLRFALVVIGWEPSDPRLAVRHRDEPRVRDVSRLRALAPQARVLVLLDRRTNLETCQALVDAGVSGFIEVDHGVVPADMLRERIVGMTGVPAGSDRSPGVDTLANALDDIGFVGKSRVLTDLLAQVHRAALVSDVPVLIYGESGTGKQVLAETIHRLDPKRNTCRFVSVNCASITGSLAESALFGHVKGAYTGATEHRLGYFRAAEGGTILLDEIGELDPALQPKLLHVLESGQVLPVGADMERSVDVRVIAATNRRLEALVEQRRFRLDLFQRLNVVFLEIPPLRERREDVPLLVRHFLRKYARYYAQPVVAVDERVYELLAQRGLEGNVRELENLVRRTLALKTTGDRITLADLPLTMLRRSRAGRVEGMVPKDVVTNVCHRIRRGETSLPEFVEECERLVLVQVLHDSENHSQLAQTLGVSRRTLYNKRRKHRL